MGKIILLLFISGLYAPMAFSNQDLGLEMITCDDIELKIVPRPTKGPEEDRAYIIYRDGELVGTEFIRKVYERGTSEDSPGDYYQDIIVFKYSYAKHSFLYYQIHSQRLFLEHEGLGENDGHKNCEYNLDISY